MTVPTHYKSVSRGFWASFDIVLPPAALTALPATADRYYESVHFAELAISLDPLEDHAARVNWYASAHMAAYIGIFDAAKRDLQRREIAFESSPLYKERNANPETSDPRYKDPINANHLYRAIRNLRVHFGISVVSLDTRQLVSDKPHWYISLIEPSMYRLLDYPRLTDLELRRYNGYLQLETIMDVFGRMLTIIRESVIETAAMVRSDS